MNEQKLINLIGEIGRLLLKHGAEIYRVEESLLRMCKSYGYLNVEVFALPSYFTLTIEMHDNHTYTLSKRTQQNRVNLDMVYELNNLVRYTCQECPDYIHLKSKKHTNQHALSISRLWVRNWVFYNFFWWWNPRNNYCCRNWIYLIFLYLVNGNIRNK